MYKATYKCRMCGESEIMPFKSYNEEYFKRIFTSGNIDTSAFSVHKEYCHPIAHICPDGSIGYADFVGFKKGE